MLLYSITTQQTYQFPEIPDPHNIVKCYNAQNHIALIIGDLHNVHYIVYDKQNLIFPEYPQNLLNIITGIQHQQIQLIEEEQILRHVHCSSAGQFLVISIDQSTQIWELNRNTR